MSKRRLVITAVLSGQSQSEVARRYGVSQGWISKLMARYRTEGEAAFQARSRRPKTNPNATAPPTVDLVLDIRRRLSRAGLDAGAETIAWHLEHTHSTTLSRPTINRILSRAGLVKPEPAKRPKSSYIRFQADQPNECWQSDFTHYRLTRPDGRAGTDMEIIAWLDDHSRYLLRASAHQRITAKIVHATFCQAGDLHGYPAGTLTDNGMVYTVRLAGAKNRGGRTALEAELHRRGITQKNGKPNHPTTQGKIERLWQTMKKWLRAQPDQPATLTELQTLLDAFTDQYNNHRPHRSLPHRATPATAYNNRIKATPGTALATPSHDRVRTDRIDASGVVTLRVAGKLRHIGIGRAHARTHVKLLIHDLDVTVINASTGEILRELTIDLTRDYQPTSKPPSPTKN
ncbi:integrase core domain-containing protein [Pseudactinotalea suaedae]|uniref:integrase core domain-containing protein n=1 Tax=Pseudactinotalea suaedae TaxID=1524924 RepID=UPI0012E27757|nr:integrase core domain-containing protein [Pseudactinotalea suaedae]